MARHVFFTFHYQHDITRVNVVRNHWVTKLNGREAGYWDASLWEEAKKKGDVALKRLITEGLRGTSVTAVLDGAHTAGRKWVTYEIVQSHNRGNGIICVYINRIKNLRGLANARGRNPLDDIYLEEDEGRRTYLSTLYPAYDWVRDDGYTNFGKWVEKAARAAGR